MVAPSKMVALPDELVEDILLRLTPDDPKHLVRAALVCKRWCRLVSAPAFRRRLRDFHRAAPMLGVLCNIGGYEDEPNFQYVACFVPTSPFRPRGALRRRDWRVLDARHGRILLRSLSRRNGNHALIVWDPVTGREQELPPPPLCSYIWNGAVLCGGDCNHLNCRNVPFLIIVVSTIDYRQTFVVVYSSEANAWSEEATEIGKRIDWFQPSVLVENALYFLPKSQTEILKYNLCTREISEIQLPPMFDWPMPNLLIIAMDGQLGFSMVHNSKVYLWVREVGPKGYAHSHVHELPSCAPSPSPCALLVFAMGHTNGGLGLFSALFGCFSRRIKEEHGDNHKLAVDGGGTGGCDDGVFTGDDIVPPEIAGDMYKAPAEPVVDDGAANKNAAVEDYCGVAPASGGTALSDLTDDLIAVIVCRVSPEIVPTSRHRVELVCKSWHRIVSDPGFRRCHFDLHRAPMVSLVYTGMHIS